MIDNGHDRSSQVVVAPRRSSEHVDLGISPQRTRPAEITRLGKSGRNVGFSCSGNNPRQPGFSAGRASTC